MKSVSLYGAIPMRSAPSECAEMVSQILFGEVFETLREEGRWTFVRTLFDNYEGWVDAKLVEPMSDDDCSVWRQEEAHIVSTLMLSVRRDDNPMRQMLAMGSELHFASPSDGSFHIGRHSYSFNPADLLCEDSLSLREVAMRLFATPYLWGGRSAFGIDCSAFVQTVYRVMGRSLPRDAGQQAAFGCEVSVDDASEGDLVFCSNDDGRVCHVGLALGNSQIIHSSGSVRIDTLTPDGIFNSERRLFSHRNIVVKRL